MELTTILHTYVFGFPVLTIILFAALALIGWKILGTLLRAGIKLAVLAALAIIILFAAPSVFGKDGKALHNSLTNAKNCIALSRGKNHGKITPAAVRRCTSQASKLAKASKKHK